MKKNIGLYIHFPFCEQKCKYCDFCSFSNLDSYQHSYVDKLIQEIKDWAGQESENVRIDTVFLGGGTPSVMSKGLIKKVLDCVYQNFDCSKVQEITIECNPNSFTQEKLNEYKSVKINRISLGVQSLDDKVLTAIGRLHTSSQALQAISLLKENNVNFSVDLMSGLPYQTFSSFKETIQNIINLKPNHISCYNLILEENTPLFKMIEQKEITLPSEEDCLKMYYYALKELEKNGYKQYEVSNFSFVDFECKHNINYWECGEYLGFGLNAHSYYNGYRFSNTDNFYNYLNKETFSLHSAEFCEKIDLYDKKVEFIMLGLRMNRGIDLIKYSQLFNKDLLLEKKDVINKLQKNNLINIKNNFLFVLQSAMRVLNQIILELID